MAANDDTFKSVGQTIDEYTDTAYKKQFDPWHINAQIFHAMFNISMFQFPI